MGCAVVGIEGGAGWRLWVSELQQHGEDGAGVFAAHEYSASFGFSGRGDDVLDGLAKDVDRAVDAVAVGPAEMVVGGCSASGLWLDEVCSVAGRLQDHVAGVIADDGIGKGGQVLHQHRGAVDGRGCWGGLLGGNLVERCEDARVDAATVVHKCTIDCLDADSAGFVERLIVWLAGWELG